MHPIVIKAAKTIGSLFVTVGLPAVGELFAKKSLDAQIKKVAAEVAAETVKEMMKNMK
jgi:hypothetical protein